MQTATNRGCVRYMLMRPSQTRSNDAFMRGQEAPLHDGDALSERGAAWCDRLVDGVRDNALPTFHAFARGREQRSDAWIHVAEPIAVHDGSAAAISTYEALFGAWNTAHPTEAPANSHADSLVEQLLARQFSESDEASPRHFNSCITPVVIIASTDYILRMLRDVLKCPEFFCGLALCSISMYDVFHEDSSDYALYVQRPFLHCVGNTALVDDVAWWCNAPRH